MKMSAIKVGVFYMTKAQDVVKVLRVGGTFPPSILAYSMTRGRHSLEARDFVRKLDDGEAPIHRDAINERLQEGT